MLQRSTLPRVHTITFKTSLKTRAHILSISQSSTLATPAVFKHEFLQIPLSLHHFFPRTHALHLRPSLSQTDNAEKANSAIVYTAAISKISMTILTVGRRGQSERGESHRPMNLRERERANSQLWKHGEEMGGVENNRQKHKKRNRNEENKDKANGRRESVREGNDATIRKTRGTTLFSCKSSTRERGNRGVYARRYLVTWHRRSEPDTLFNLAVYRLSYQQETNNEHRCFAWQCIVFLLALF